MKKLARLAALLLSVSMISTAAIMTSACDDKEDKNPSDITTPGGDTPGGETPGGSETPDTKKAVKSIKVQTKPKAEFAAGDTFTCEGGMLLVTYADGTTETISMTAEGVKVTPPGLNAEGTKTVKISYGGKNCSYTVKVAAKSYNVTFNLNYEGAPENSVSKVLQGKKVTAPEVSRQGYTLYGWYKSTEYIEKYDFESEVNAETTLYALWLKDGVTSCNVTFDYDYYGAKISKYTYPVDSGSKISKPSNPTRTGYEFVKWVDASGNEFNFDTAISSATTIKATWNKTVTGTHDYIFEAEDTNLDGKVGPALSGQAVGAGMIVKIDDRNASGGRYVSFLYQTGLSVDFLFASDIATNDATISISLSAEYRDYTFNPSNYQIVLNDVPLSYNNIVFTGVPEGTIDKVDCLPFQYYLIGTGLTLKKGANTLKLITNNNDKMEGTTMLSAAPSVDAVKINTSAVLTWDGAKNLPVLDNYKH